MITSLGSSAPRIEPSVWVAPSAWILGAVSLGEHASVFFNSVLRGDILPIEIGPETNIQEHCLLHTSHGRTPTIVGSQVTVGHRAIIHGATVGNRCLIGMGSIILDETVIEDECVIAAGALVAEGKRIPSRSLVMGVPGKIVREVQDHEIANILESARAYVQTARELRRAIEDSQSS